MYNKQIYVIFLNNMVIIYINGHLTDDFDIYCKGKGTDYICL